MIKLRHIGYNPLFVYSWLPKNQNTFFFQEQYADDSSAHITQSWPWSSLWTTLAQYNMLHTMWVLWKP